jgi:hypothetical protein
METIMQTMQRIATQLFMLASVTFGVLGILLVLTSGGGNDSTGQHVLEKSFMISVFVILPSFALSVAGKYLTDRTA